MLLVLWGIWELDPLDLGPRGLDVAVPGQRHDDAAHPHDLPGAWRARSSQGPLLITVLLHAAWFTAKEALVGFALGATFGFVLAIALVHSRLAQRAFLPYIVASQTIPILAVAPMVVVWLSPAGSRWR